MKISLFQGILFGLFGLAALIGLFVFATYTNKGGGAETIGTVVIWGTLPSEAMQAAFTTVAQTDASFKDVSYVEKDSATLAPTLAAAIATGGAPDLILASQEQLQAIEKFIMPISLSTLPARTFSDTFIREGDLFAVPSGGGYWGIPFLVDPLVLFVNRSMLASSGIAKPPATWEALVGLVPRVVQTTPSRQISRGLIALGTYNNVHDARGILSTLFLQSGIPISGYSVTGVLAANLGSTGDSLGQAALGFYTQFTDPSKISYTWNASLPDSLQAFLAGDLALYLGYASRARYLRAANPNLDLNVAPVPQPATAALKSTYGLIYAFMIPRGAANAAGGYHVAASLTNSAGQAAAAGAAGLAPASLAQLAQLPAEPAAAVAYAEALYAAGWLSPASEDTDAVFSSMIGNVISGRMNLQIALATAERTLSALLQQ